MGNYNNYIDRIALRNRLWIPLAASIIVTTLIPFPLIWIQLPQANTINGAYLKEGNRAYEVFVRGIKNSNGVLILGTSETDNKLDGLNYWGFLNKDKLVKPYFSILAGAGRTSSIYFPLILKNPEVFKKLKILLYINPTYWRHGLSNFNTFYYTRYIGPFLFTNTKNAVMQRGLYSKFMKLALLDTLFADGVQLGLKEQIYQNVNTFKSYYNYDLARILFNSENMIKDQTFDPISHEQIAEYKKGVDSSYNATFSFIAKDAPPFPQIDTESTFRYEELKEFLLLCNDYQINVTVYLGPYNSVYCKKKNPELIEQYEEVMTNIRMIIANAGVPFIDGSSISYTPGTFLDVQHISKYGAFITAQQIKKHYEKNY
jgi:hypothetical protein